MERAVADLFGAALHQPNARCLHQPNKADLGVQSPGIALKYANHSPPSKMPYTRFIKSHIRHVLAD
jgi:hypothetical protein